MNLREISKRILLPAGRYCIIPCTFERGNEGQFLLRVFVEKKWGQADGAKGRFKHLQIVLLKNSSHFGHFTEIEFLIFMLLSSSPQVKVLVSRLTRDHCGGLRLDDERRQPKFLMILTVSTVV